MQRRSTGRALRARTEGGHLYVRWVYRRDVALQRGRQSAGGSVSCHAAVATPQRTRPTGLNWLATARSVSPAQVRTIHFVLLSRSERLDLAGNEGGGVADLVRKAPLHLAARIAHAIGISAGPHLPFGKVQAPTFDCANMA